MNIKLFIAGMIAALCRIIYAGYTPLLYYWAALMIIVILLNTRSAYRTYSLFANTVFLLYIFFITWVRTRPYQFSADTEYWLNNCEHLLFAVVICLLISLFIRTVVYPQGSFIQTLLSTVVAFNCIGVINEVFQNSINHHSLFVLSNDSQKDLLMNLAGTALFIPLAVCWHYNKSWLKFNTP
jgi:hypothetical protein